MKNKTRKKLLKKLRNLPVYHVDSSIFIEAIFGQPRADRCIKLFQIAGRRFILKVSSTVLGEVVKGINRFEDDVERNLAFELFDDLLFRRNIIVYTPSLKALLIYLPQIHDYDPFLQSMDLLNVASAVDDNAEKFFVFDSDLNNNRVLEKRSGIKFLEP